MKIGVLGSGDVGQALGKGFLALGHDVKMGSREKGNAKAEAWAKAQGAKASTGTFAEAAAFGELIVLATLGVANEAALAAAGPATFKGKIVIDTTNPLNHSNGTLTLAITGADSAGERVQKQLPGAQVVKAFNTVGNAHMFQPKFDGGPPDMFICGNDDAAKKKVTALLKDFGWATVDIGGIEGSRYLEAMCIVWCLHGFKTNTWGHAFKLLRK